MAATDNRSYTGVLYLEGLPRDLINTLHTQKKAPLSWLPEECITYYPHQFLVLKADNKASALAKVSFNCKFISLLDSNIEASGIIPKNKEQIMALNVLMDEQIPLVVLTGRAGTGKTLLTLATAIQKMQEQSYERLIITRPMSQVGRRDIGALPGDVDEKFNPYLMNYTSNLEQLVGKKSVRDAIHQCKAEFIPMQLIRGASFFNALVIADEVQVLDRHEMLTLGSRIGEGSKLIVMGDLAQRDEKIARHDTGMFKLMNNDRIKNSPLAASIELQRVERSQLSQLFAEVFDEE